MLKSIWCNTKILITLVLFHCVLGSVAFAKESTLIPMEAWIHDPVISDVTVSPDGKKIAALTLSDPSAPPDITVWDTRNLGKPPKRFAPEDSKAIDVFWVNNNKLLVIGRQKFDWRKGARPILTFRNIVYLVDAKGKKFRTIYGDETGESRIIRATIASTLRKDPDHILLQLTNDQFAEEFHKLNLKRYNTIRVFKGGENKSFEANTIGDIFLQLDIEGAGENVHQVKKIRKNDNDKWTEHFKLYATKREGIINVEKTADGTFYVTDNTNREFSVIRKYNPDTRKLSEPVFADEGYEIVSVITSTTDHNYGNVVGYIRDGAKRERVYTDPLYQELQQRIDSALGSETQNQMVSLSDDMSMIIVESSGVKEAGAYYLLVGGKQLVPLGRQYPNLKPEQMGEMTFVHYKARDGLSIPGFLTIPSSGKPPFPAVIMPHGGPWARDYLRWDSWAQFLASRGYLVLQPQYRGSEGLGQTLWRAGDREWGQKMQDDKDDGAAWLVKQGLADKDRIAMYGYSYGGYAAMAASVRKNSPYQCAIAGAGLSELDSFDKVTFTNPFNREYQNPTIAGLSPLYNVKDANIPIYIFHGDRDQRVPVDQSRKFAAALKRAKKDVKYYEIPDLWHSYPWFPQHVLTVYSTIEDYLANDCGPGGL